VNVGIRTSSSTSQPSSVTLPAQGHTSFAFPTEFATTVGQSGLAEFYGPTGTFSILALKFNAGAFTTAPVYSESGPPIIASSTGAGASAYDGTYTGTFTATAGQQSKSGEVSATISNGTVTVAFPGNGSGTISAGQITFGVDISGGTTCNFNGTIVLAGTAGTGSGTFSCTNPSFAGTWTVSRQ
jgi:hypothetical protein